MGAGVLGCGEPAFPRKGDRGPEAPSRKCGGLAGADAGAVWSFLSRSDFLPEFQQMAKSGSRNCPKTEGKFDSLERFGVIEETYGL